MTLAVAYPAGAMLLLLGVCGLAMLGLSMLIGGSSRRARLEDRSTLVVPGPERGRLLRVIDRRLEGTRRGEAIAVRLAAAGSSLTPADFVVVTGGTFLVAFVLLGVLVPGIVAFIVAIPAAAGLWLWLGRRREKRRAAFVGQLPEMARILSNGTAAGLSMAGAIELSGNELEDPAGAELRTISAEQRLGVPLDESLQRLRGRLPSREVAVLMTTLIIQTRAGGDTVRALQELADTLDQRKETLREVRTLMSGAVFTSYIVAGMGGAAILVLNLVSPGVLGEVTSSAVGLLALVISGVLYAVGFTIIRTTTRIDL